MKYPPVEQVEGVACLLPPIPCDTKDLAALKNASLPIVLPSEIAQLKSSLPGYNTDLTDIGPVQQLHYHEQVIATLTRITKNIDRGLTLDAVLDNLYDEMWTLIPYDRIGFALFDRGNGVVSSRWTRSRFSVGETAQYSAPIHGSSLGEIVLSGEPRIINDLESYLADHPASHSTKLIVDEGMRSSLTCPLLVEGLPIGFVFFSSAQPDTYGNGHIRYFQQLAEHLAIILEKSRLYQQLAEQKELLDQRERTMQLDLDIARRVQRNLIPDSSFKFPGLDIAFCYEPAQKIGGDILDLIRITETQLLVFVGDAMGHGISAALVMAATKSELRAAVQTDPNPASVLGVMNSTLMRLFPDRFVTAACGVINLDSQLLEIALAGHASPLHLRKGSSEFVQFKTESALPLGILPGSRYASSVIELKEDDLLLFMTDGIVEASDSHGGLFGYKRLSSIMLHQQHASASKICDSIMHKLAQHCGDSEPSDDLLALAIRISGLPVGYLI